MLRLATRIVGALAIVAAFFFGTLFILNWLDSLPFPDSERANHGRQLKAALEAYRAARGQYPTPFTDNPATDLKKELVDGKFIAAIPQDPLWKLQPDKQYRYVSYDGKIYGLLFHLQFPVGKIPAGGSCVTGTPGTGFWQNAPQCPF